MVLAVVLASCGGTSQGEEDMPLGAHLADADIIDDPGAWVGPSTALLAESDDESVTELAPDEQSLPVTVTDSQGTEVTVSDTSRVLALDVYGTLARTVYELGLGDTLVGRDTSTGFAAAADLPLVTPSGHDLNAESILALDPSLIITDTTLGPWDVILQMREAGIPVVIVDSERRLETAGDLVRDVAEILGVPERGEDLATDLEADIADVTQQISEIAPDDEDALRMAFLYVRGNAGIYYLFGAESGTDSLITSLGGRDVATEVGWTGMRPVTDEGIIAMEPDVLLVMTAGLESAGGVDGLLESVPALALTPAGENRRIVDMADSEILSFGPMSARVLEALAVAVYAPETAQAAVDAEGEAG
jgi:iron complex transport system substrate-binding protein